MKKLSLVSITALTLIVPALADPVTPNIAVGTNPADCTEPVLGTTSGTSNLQANWTANTLNLQWTAPDADNWSAQNNTCTYDSGITVPQTNPSRTGYTFAGWHVKTAAVTPATPAQTGFDLSTWNYGDVPEWNAQYTRWKSLDPENASTMEDDFGIENSSDLSNGEWAVTFGNGTVKGTATCSSQHPITPWYESGEFTSDNFSTTLTAGQYNDTDAQYCWCKATGVNTGSGYQSVAGSKWVFSSDAGVAGGCAAICARICAYGVQYDGGFRGAVFGTYGN